ncbi:deacetylvindoline O-acetyltransferase-like [Abrus precatorius]|uniref:Deacetylvindoline O-acetyltransferase-like n=1 Tax=Abrus precatorius TaxID=3816 RepID=A0A8B8M249_ABRPR|nr:deacetylvindoline O-acetyltransferase-like [Abrus precatorius]
MEGHENGGKLEIVAIMSVPPLKVTEPRRVRKVLVSEEHRRTIEGCYQTVLYYEKLKEEEHGWSLAGWIVESLAMVLLDYPLLAGRLQRREVGDETELEIVSNDSGIRLLEARFPTSLPEFLALNQKEHLEAELVFWKEIDAHSPNFSPLFYVQVTNFECGGYSIGISCSVLLAEALLVENFLEKWAQIHNKMSTKNEEIKTPIFYHPRLKTPESLPSDIITRTKSKNGVQNMVFKITFEDVNFQKELWRELAMLCVEDAEKKLSTNMGSGFSLVVKESSDVIKVESCSKNGWSVKGLRLKHQITGTTWNHFGVYEVAFTEGNKPVHVSCWIGSVADGHVMAVPCLKENACGGVIVVSPPPFH